MKVLQHFNTCWLSMNNALERLNNNIDQIKLCLIGMDKQDLVNLHMTIQKKQLQFMNYI